MKSTKEYQMLLEDYMQAWHQRDAESIASCFASGGVFTVPTVEPMKGDEIAQYTRGLFDAFPDFEITEYRYVQGEGNEIAIEWTFEGTHMNTYKNIPASNNRVRLSGCNYCTVKDGKFTRVNMYYDLMNYLSQLGVNFG